MERRLPQSEAAAMALRAYDGESGACSPSTRIAQANTRMRMWGLVWVTLRRSHGEHMFSALPAIAEIFKLPGGDRGRSAARNVMQASFASSLPLSWLATDRKMKKAPPNWVYIFAVALFSYFVVGGAFVYDFLYGEIALHTRGRAPVPGHCWL